ncbi:hypothetical protein Trydic_g14297 [Trypoxylus dichotomus]
MQVRLLFRHSSHDAQLGPHLDLWPAMSLLSFKSGGCGFGRATGERTVEVGLQTAGLGVATKRGCSIIYIVARTCTPLQACFDSIG